MSINIRLQKYQNWLQYNLKIITGHISYLQYSKLLSVLIEIRISLRRYVIRLVPFANYGQYQKIDNHLNTLNIAKTRDLE